MGHREGEEDKVRFRSDRFFCEDGQWYFTTRENAIKGPYESRDDAERDLEMYLHDLRQREKFGLPEQE
jgi:hypothetical protein